MSFFVQPITAPRPKTDTIRTLSIALASVFVLMAVAQLFTYEKFAGVIASLWLPGGTQLAPIRAAFIVIFEVGALPFLLFMKLSPAMRVVSMVAGWLVVACWLTISLWENLTTNVISNSGFLGATVHLPVGWWSVLLSIALGIMVGWVSWGMWPFGNKYKK